MYTQTPPVTYRLISQPYQHTRPLQSTLGDSLRREKDFLYQWEQTEQLSWLEKRLIPTALRLIDGVHYLLALGKKVPLLIPSVIYGSLTTTPRNNRENPLQPSTAMLPLIDNRCEVIKKFQEATF